MVIAYARKNGKSFINTFSSLLARKSLNKSSLSVQHLNFADPGVRGDDLKISLLSLGQFSKNDYAYKTKLKSLVGAKSERDLIKKVVSYDFDDSLLLICALGSQLNRLEKRYILSGITFKEAYARKYDHFNTLLSVIFDLREHGLTTNIKHYIYEFTSEIVNPDFDLTTIDTSKAVSIPKENDNNNKNGDDDNKNDIIDTSFSFDGKNIVYNASKDFGCSIGVDTPVWNNYKSKRQHFGTTGKESLFDKYSRDKIMPRFCSNGSCFEYNFGWSGSPFSKGCKNTEPEHVKKHYCANLAGPHPALLCPFTRCTCFLTSNKNENWFTQNYTYAVRYPAKPYPKKGNNNNNNNNDHHSGDDGYQNRPYHGSPGISTRGYQDRNHGYQHGYDPRRDQHHYDNRNRGGRGYNNNNNNRKNGNEKGDNRNRHNDNQGFDDCQKR